VRAISACSIPAAMEGISRSVPVQPWIMNPTGMSPGPRQGNERAPPSKKLASTSKQQCIHPHVLGLVGNLPDEMRFDRDGVTSVSSIDVRDRTPSIIERRWRKRSG
jgi:hypothetical protein